MDSSRSSRDGVMPWNCFPCYMALCERNPLLDHEFTVRRGFSRLIWLLRISNVFEMIRQLYSKEHKKSREVFMRLKVWNNDLNQMKILIYKWPRWYWIRQWGLLYVWIITTYSILCILCGIMRTKETGGRLNKKDGLTRYGDSHVKDKTS